MSNNSHNDIDFFILQLASNIEAPQAQKWISEIAMVIQSLGGRSLIPGRISRSEPLLRRYGSEVIDEPLDDDMRRGAFKRIRELAVTRQIQAYIVHDMASLAIATRLRQEINQPIIFVTHELLEKKGFGIFSKTNSQLKAVSRFIVPSEMLRDHLMRQCQIPQDHISLVNEGIDLTMISSEQVSQERTASLAHSWGAIEDVTDLILIPAVYRDPAWRKNLLDLAGALNTREELNARLIIIGDDDGGGEMQNLRHQIETRSPNAPMRFVGYCADIEAAVKLSSGLLMLDCPTQTSFPMAIIAQALGRHVLLPENHLAAEVFIDVNKSGQLVAPNASSQISGLQTLLARDESQRNSSAMAGRIFATQYFSREQMHKKLAEIFEDPSLLRH